MSNPKPHKIIVTGTGRCGTTFLMRIFTYLGLPTGCSDITEDNITMVHNCNSGYEIAIEETILGIDTTNYIVKSPKFLTHINDIYKHYKIDLIILPIRDFSKCALSRTKYGKDPGGMIWGATDYNSQLQSFYASLSNFLLTTTQLNIDVIFIDFNLMVDDYDYLHEKLSFLIKKYKVGKKQFINAFNKASFQSRTIYHI